MKIKRLRFWTIFIFFFLFPLSGFAKTTDHRPNILFILTDDLRWDTLGCYGSHDIRTPNLDKFASEGARLDAFYVASPLCCPSRAVFLSGLYPHQNGVEWNVGMPDLKEGTQTVATLLNRAGYATGFIGKAHLGGNPYKWDFTNCPVFFPRIQMRHLDPTLFVHGKRQVVPGYITEIFTNTAISFLEKHKNERWFLWFATTAPHLPYHVPL